MVYGTHENLPEGGVSGPIHAFPEYPLHFRPPLIQILLELDGLFRGPISHETPIDLDGLRHPFSHFPESFNTLLKGHLQFFDSPFVEDSVVWGLPEKVDSDIQIPSP